LAKAYDLIMYAKIKPNKLPVRKYPSNEFKILLSKNTNN